MTISDGARPGDDKNDATVVRPQAVRVPPPVAPEPMLTPAPVVATPLVAPLDLGQFSAGSSNPLLHAANPLMLLSVQLRHSAGAPDARFLREQSIAYVRQFESAGEAAGLPAQTVVAARYVLCTVLDEAVLNAPWGEQSGWAQKTLLVSFHGETYGGAKFFQILERLCADFSRHLDLIEMMYICLALGFGGRYQVEVGGQARLIEIQQDLYQRIRAQRGALAPELAPHWRGVQERRSRLVRYVPLWVIAALAACAVLATFLYFFTRLNLLASPINAQLAQLGLEDVRPPMVTAPVRHDVSPRKSLKQLLAPQERAGELSVDEQADGKATVRLAAAEMFPSGGFQIGPAQLPLLHLITAALNQVDGRVVVVGHTDDQPIHSLQFKDNYALSAARAHSVMQILSQGINDPARLNSIGAGDSQPIAVPVDLPANRARNRRVEIQFIPEH
ncbi:MAG: type IVB secretion system protein IcmH/DotU [Dyella sp.]